MSKEFLAIFVMLVLCTAMIIGGIPQKIGYELAQQQTESKFQDVQPKDVYFQE